MGERRTAIRHKSFLRGCVYFNRRRSAFDCLIRDISEEGARIIFSDAVSVPDVVELYIPQKDEMLRARVKWRHGDEIGLTFTAAARPAGPDIARPHAPSDGELAARVGQLETEIASLRRVLKRLKDEITPRDGGDAA